MRQLKYLSLVCLTACFAQYRAIFNVETARGANLNILGDTLCFKHSGSNPSIGEANLVQDFATLFKREGFNVTELQDKANIVVKVKREKKLYETSYNKQVVDSSSSNQWVYNQNTGQMENKPVQQETIKTVPVKEKVARYQVSAIFVRVVNGKEERIIDSHVIVDVYNFDNDPRTYLLKLFEMIRDGQEIKNKTLAWSKEKGE